MFKSNLTRAARSIALTATIIYGAFITPELHNHYLRYEVGTNVVKVLGVTHEGGGTGFAVRAESGKELILTNLHVCEGTELNNNVRIQVSEKKTVLKKIVYRDDIHDLCLIEGIKGLDPLSIGSDQSLGESMYVIGHPGLRPLSVSKGEYVGRSEVKLIFDVPDRQSCPGEVIELPPFYQMLMDKEFVCVRKYKALSTTGVIYPGNSGSPVVNMYGNLIGVAFAGSTVQEHDNYVIPLFYIKRVLSKF